MAEKLRRLVRKLPVCSHSRARTVRLRYSCSDPRNVINQGDALFGAAPINWLKVILTYFVPYAVCTYGAVSFQLRKMRS